MNSSLFLTPWGQKLAKELTKGRSKFKPRFETSKWNIVRGDKVEVIQGLQRGQKGTVTAVLRRQNRLIIDGVNLRRRIVKPLPDGTPGRIITKPCSIHYSNAMLIDPSTGKPTKVSRKYLEDGKKIRVSRKTNTLMPKPQASLNRTPRSLLVGAKDTDPKDVFDVTFPDYEKYLPFIYATIRRAKESK